MELDDFKDFTPEKWEVEVNTSDTCNFAVISPFEQWTTVAGEYGIKNENDAKLIAAAPELLAECRRLTQENADLKSEIKLVKNGD